LPPRFLQLAFNGKEVPDSEQLSKLGLVNTTASIKVGGALQYVLGAPTTALCAACDMLHQQQHSHSRSQQRCRPAL